MAPGQDGQPSGCGIWECVCVPWSQKQTWTSTGGSGGTEGRAKPWEAGHIPQPWGPQPARDRAPPRRRPGADRLRGLGGAGPLVPSCIQLWAPQGLGCLGSCSLQDKPAGKLNQDHGAGGLPMFQPPVDVGTLEQPSLALSLFPTCRKGGGIPGRGLDRRETPAPCPGPTSVSPLPACLAELGTWPVFLLPSSSPMPQAA